MKIFEIDYRRLVALLLPPGLRKSRMQAWLNALVYPVQLLYNDFKANRRNNLYRISITPQVCFLEKAINDRYDYVERRIRIADVLLKEVLFIYQRNENKPLMLYRRSDNRPLNLYLRTETNSVTVDFLVLLPSGLRYAEDEMRAFIDSYKLASKDYKIQLT
ncbi:hypothetical protein CLV59_109155 [Chitinophaga dinghuensis]|uniref:Uncharacterized protein n=1 Tax=Chitinophaga dinghuensis TaxID=1539050 RepID=A0A327VWI5_9BACT|nr:hypothetical protein [Chitinophaga dinghuensis]RAJ75541.1 hypothetical protein CLV59_109155 [Chitinophaga dinghuensis]